MIKLDALVLYLQTRFVSFLLATQARALRRVY